MTQTFKGFPKDLPDFLWGIALNNEKPWFEARRDIYERALHGPMKALSGDLAEALMETHGDLALRTHVSRIYRDARTLNGRGPLNDHMWFSIGKTARVYETEPQFYFGIEARCCDWGMGLWSVTAADMERWRAAIDAAPVRMRRLLGRLREKTGMELLGGSYKRPKGDPGPALFDWYNAKNFVLGKTVWFEPDPPGPELCEQVLRDYQALVPIYKYLSEFCTGR